MVAVETNVKTDASMLCMSGRGSLFGLQRGNSGQFRCGHLVGVHWVLDIFVLIELFMSMLTPERCDDDLGYSASCHSRTQKK